MQVPEPAEAREIITSAGSLDALDRCVHALIEPVGMWAYTIGSAPLLRGQVQSGRAALHSTLPAEFQRAYHARESAAFDPMFDMMARRFEPFTKSSIDAAFTSAPASSKIMEQAVEHGIAEALMTPLNTADRSRGVVFFTVDCPAEFAARLRVIGPWLHTLAVIVIKHAEDLGFGPAALSDPQAVGLTAREAECLAWCARGKSNDEISFSLGISERTVRFHISNACRKLGTDRRTEAVTRAVQIGLIRT